MSCVRGARSSRRRPSRPLRRGRERHQIEQELEAVGPAAEARPRRRWPRARASARSSRDAAMARSRRLTRSAIAPRRCAMPSRPFRDGSSRRGRCWSSCWRLRPTDQPDPEAQTRIAALSRELEALERDREAELARQLAELEQQLAAAAGLETRTGRDGRGCQGCARGGRGRLSRRRARRCARPSAPLRRRGGRAPGRRGAGGGQPVPARPSERARRRAFARG